MPRSLPSLSPVGRIALGLVAQMVSIVLLVSTVLGVMHDRIEAARQLRIVISESLAQQAAHLLQRGDQARLELVMQQALNRYDSLRSLALRRAGGEIAAAAGPHATAWQAPEAGGSELDNIAVPIQAGQTRWGDVELHFRAAYPQTPGEWLRYPPIAALILLSGLGFMAFYLYLRRALQYLDPLAVIPERVRMAYDTFREAVLVVDPQGRVILANDAFRHLHPDASGVINGKPASQLAWLVANLPMVDTLPPWLHAMRAKLPLSGLAMDLAVPGQDDASKLLLNCTPILDGYGNVRGCMVILYDVTALHRANRQLTETLSQLAAAKRLVDDKNRELETLATRDPMTGCLNRRALFAQLAPLFAGASRENAELCCVMGDIDHFKKFNDTYGHSVGDQVIKAVARTLGAGLRDGDLLCRYGGEEFCIFLPGVSPEQAWSITDRLRRDVEAEAGRSIRDQEGLRVTSSFGVASIRHGAEKFEALIDLADAALYHSKKTGRNRVTIWRAGLDAAA